MKRFCLLLCLFAALAMFSCNNNGPTSSPPKPNPVKLGSLKIEVTGLINGLKGNITVTGPNSYHHHYDSSVTISGIPTGEYTVLAFPVVDSLGDTIAVNPDSQVVHVQENKTATANLFYQSVAVGSLSITASGLPSGEAYDIVITSQNDLSFSRQITQSVRLDSLKPGPYRIVAKEIVIKGEKYKPNILDQIINIVGGVFSSISIIYRPEYGRMSVLIIGLPSGTDADVEIHGPGNMYDNLFQSGVIDSLKAGDYTILAHEVVSKNGMPYVATPDSQKVTVVGGQDASAKIDYRAKFGVLVLDIKGLPKGTDPDVIVAGAGLPGGWQQYYESQWIDSLIGGDYSIIAKSVTDNNGTKYIPDLDSQVVSVVGGDTSFASVEYKENIGALSVLIIGLPSNTNADVEVTGPGNFSKQLNQTNLLDSLEPGNYSIVGYDVTTNDGTAYAPDPDSQLVVVAVGDTAESIIDYKPKHGVMWVSITGLPSGVDADVYIKGPNFPERNFIRSEWIDSLDPGDFSVIGLEVTDNKGTVFKPDIDSQIVAVVAGDTSYAFIVYEKQLGVLKLDVNGLPDNVPAHVVVAKDDDSFTALLEGSIILDSLEPGRYLITYEGVTDQARSIPYYVKYPSGDTAYRAVTAGDTTYMSVTYAKRFGFEVYDDDYNKRLHGKTVGWCCNTYSDCTNESLETDYYDSSTMTYGYDIIGCDSISSVHDITDSGWSRSISHSGMFGQASASRQVSVSRAARTISIVNTLDLTTTVPTCDWNGSERVYADIDRGWFPMIVHIYNPKNDTVRIRLDYSASGVAVYDTSSRAGSGLFCVGASGFAGLQTDYAVNPCIINGSNRQQIFQLSYGRTAEKEDFGNSISGSEELVLTGSVFLQIKFDNVGEACAVFRHEYTQNDGQDAGQSSLTSSVLITIEHVMGK